MKEDEVHKIDSHWLQEDEEGKWKRIPIDTVIEQVKALQMESFKTVPEKN